MDEMVKEDVQRRLCDVLRMISSRNNREEYEAHQTEDFERIEAGAFESIKVKYFINCDEEVDRYVFFEKLKKGTEEIKLYTAELYFDDDADKFLTYMFVDNGLYNFVGLYVMNYENESALVYGTNNYDDKSYVVDKFVDELEYSVPGFVRPWRL